MSTSVNEDRRKLIAIELDTCRRNSQPLLNALANDCVALVRDVSPSEADLLIDKIAASLGLSDRLAMQANLASIAGHRHNIGKHFMSVNQRHDYQFIPPHSEGNGLIRMQIASFYCFENSTDGGETILLNIDGTNALWSSLKEKCTRLSANSRVPTIDEANQLKLRHKLRSAMDGVRRSDVVLREYESYVPGIKLVDVLGKAEMSRCGILGRPLYVYWDQIASYDRDQPAMFRNLLAESGLLRLPAEGLELHQLDNSNDRRVWSSGVDHSMIFKCKLTYKLAPGDFIIQNNYSWAHATANWTPGSGVRKVAAAFA